MPNDILFNLPPILYVFAAAWFPLVAAALGAIAKQVALIPGLRPSDDSRTVLMRLLVGVLNGAGLLAFSWQQNLVLDKSMLIAFVLCAAGQTLGGHYVYQGIKNGAQSGGNVPAAPAPTASSGDPSSPALAAALAQAEAAAQAAEATLKASAASK